MSDSSPINSQRGPRYYRSAIGIAVLAGVTAVAWWQTGQDSAGKGSAAVTPEGFRPYERPARSRALLDDDDDGIELPELIGALSSNNPRIRRAAINALARRGTAAQPFLATLRPYLADADPMVRGQTANVLVQLDRNSTETAEALARLLVDNHTYVRSNVSAALCEMGSLAEPVVLPLLNDRDPTLRLQAVQILQRIDNGDGDVIAALRRLANDPDTPVREAVISALMLDRKLELAEVLQWIRDENPNVSDTAIANLPRFGRAAAAAVPDLVARLESPLPVQLSWLLFVLQSLREDAAPAIPALRRLLDSPVDYDIGGILEVLIDLGAEPQMVVPLLVRFMNDESPSLTIRAGDMLSRIDPAAARRQAMVLVEQINRRDEVAVDHALAGLRGLGVNAIDAMPQLIELLRTADQDTRDLVCQVLIRIGPGAAAAVPTIIGVIENTDPLPRTSAVLIEAAGTIGPEAAPVAPMLMELVTSTENVGRGGLRNQFVERARCAALYALAKIGVRDVEYLNYVHAALSNDSMAMRVAALQAIAIVGTPNFDVVPDILPALTHRDSNIRLTATRTIAEIAGSDSRVVSALGRLLEDDDLEVRAAAAASLGRLGPAAAEAIPALTAVRRSRNNYVPFSLMRSPRGRMSAVYRMQNQLPNSSVAQIAEDALHRIAPVNSAAQR